MWNLSRPGIDPVSPALAGGFLTTGPPEKSLCNIIIIFLIEAPDMFNKWRNEEMKKYRDLEKVTVISEASQVA